jgi:hypothetical protein
MNGGISVGGDAEAAAFGDYDLDGDQDLLVSIDGAPNQLWANSTRGESFLVVRAVRCVGGDDDDDDGGWDDDDDGGWNIAGHDPAQSDQGYDDDDDGHGDDDDDGYGDDDDDGHGDDDDDGYGEMRLRDDIGATIRIFAEDGVTPAGPVREVNGGRGHGSQDPAHVHFGLPAGPQETYIVEVRFVAGPTVRRSVNPSTLDAGHHVTITSCESARRIPRWR